MWRATLTSLIVAIGLAFGLALAGCGTSSTPAAGGSPTRASTAKAAGGGGDTTRSAPAAPGSKSERPPTCYPAILTENSGNGPTYHVQICDALRKPRPGQEWQLIVDGGPLRSQAVILGQQIPR